MFSSLVLIVYAAVLLRCSPFVDHWSNHLATTCAFMVVLQAALGGAEAVQFHEISSRPHAPQDGSCR